MKKLIVALSLVVMSFGAVVFADTQPVSVNIGIGTLQLPFQDGSVVGLLDLNHNGAALTGFETTVGTIGKVTSLSIGGIVSDVGKGTPYGGVNYTFASPTAQGLLSKLGFTAFDFGAFVGYDFSLRNSDWFQNCRYGIKVSTQFLKLLTQN